MAQFTLHLDGSAAPLEDEETGEALTFDHKGEAVLAAAEMVDEMTQAGQPEGYIAVGLQIVTDAGLETLALSVVPATAGVGAAEAIR